MSRNRIRTLLAGTAIGVAALSGTQSAMAAWVRPAPHQGPGAGQIMLVEDGDDDDDGPSSDDGGDDDEAAPAPRRRAVERDDEDDDVPVRRRRSADDDDDRDDDDGPVRQGRSSGDDDDDLDDDPEYQPYAREGRRRPLRQDEILDQDGYLARRAEIAALDASDAALARAERLGFRIRETIELSSLGTRVTILQAPRGVTVRESLRRLRAADPETIYDYNHLYGYRPTAAERPRRIAELGPPKRQALTIRDDLTIGIIDTPVNADHVILKGARIETRGFGDDADKVSSDHGTAVAAVIVGREGGLAPQARLHAASVFSLGGGGEPLGAALDLVRALDWMVTSDVAVINMSLAGPSNGLLQAAVAKAIEKGHVIVAAVGNDGPSARPLYPAAYDGVIGITAVDDERRVYRRAGRGEHVDFAAPGVDVHTVSGDGYALVSGTSFASPHVAVLVAIEMAKPDDERAKATVEGLVTGAVDLGAEGRDDVYGYGLVATDPRVISPN
jgi:subtilisin family serine protease